MACTRNKQVLVQIGEVETLLKDSGVRDFCMACINSPVGGCCHGCSNLGPNGCMDKPLSCALWTCRQVDKAFPKVWEKLNAIKRLWPHWLVSAMRMNSIQLEHKLGDKECNQISQQP